MQCLDEDAIVRLVGGAVPAGEREVYAEHLGECGACRELVAETAKSMDGVASLTIPIERAAEVPADWPELLFKPGDLIADKYRVLGVLGRGGCGYVLAAQHEGLRTPVAIKLLHQRLLERTDAVARFEREARALARIPSEHVVRVLDVAALPTGQPYIVMERLFGIDLARRLGRDGTLPYAEAVDYVLEACEGLAHAHQAGIVHRDLKPANLFVAERPNEPDEPPIVKVLDFGISKNERGSGLSQHDFSTEIYTWLGTPRYMAPEQIMLGRRVDARTDIWALGTILYELITGKAPFAGVDLESVSRMVLEQDTPAMEGVPHLPRGLGPVVRRCLEKAPRDRFANVGELACALEPFASDGGPERVARVLAVTGSFETGTTRSSRVRFWHRTLTAPSLVVVLTLLGGAAWGAMWAAHRLLVGAVPSTSAAPEAPSSLSGAASPDDPFPAPVPPATGRAATNPATSPPSGARVRARDHTELPRKHPEFGDRL